MTEELYRPEEAMSVEDRQQYYDKHFACYDSWPR